MNASKEVLYHFRCHACNQWFSIADMQPKPDQISLYCPRCGVKSKIDLASNKSEEQQRIMSTLQQEPFKKIPALHQTIFIYYKKSDELSRGTVSFVKDDFFVVEDAKWGCRLAFDIWSWKNYSLYFQQDTEAYEKETDFLTGKDRDFVERHVKKEMLETLQNNLDYIDVDHLRLLYAILANG